MKDLNHLNNGLFSLLWPGKRFHSPKTNKQRMRISFFPQAIQAFNQDPTSDYLFIHKHTNTDVGFLCTVSTHSTFPSMHPAHPAFIYKYGCVFHCNHVSSMQHSIALHVQMHRSAQNSTHSFEIYLLYLLQFFIYIFLFLICM